MAFVEVKSLNVILPIRVLMDVAQDEINTLATSNLILSQFVLIFIMLTKSRCLWSNSCINLLFRHFLYIQELKLSVAGISILTVRLQNSFGIATR